VTGEICHDSQKSKVLNTLTRSLQGIPRWPGLNQFNGLKGTSEFADGTKFEDLSKVSLSKI